MKKKGSPGAFPIGASAASFDRILALLRAVKGIDFSSYKMSTLRRRVRRRMSVARVSDKEQYLRALKTDPKEVDLLFGEILVSVTSFFREPGSFQALKTEIYPRFLKNRASGAPIRLWVPGCSTGEEAYSHAINLVESLGKDAARVPIQIFATDVNPAAIAKARAGRYTRKTTAGVSPERLRRFFVETPEGYRVCAAIRERCVFAVHNLVTDPPFTDLDLVSCRNLMIYMGPALQEKALQVFQFALKQRGVLMLGRSEAIGDSSGRFLSMNIKTGAFYERTGVAKAPLDFHRSAAEPAPAADGVDLQGTLDGVMPARYVPNGVVVNADLEIVRFLGDSSAYLRPAPGKSSLNLRRMAGGEFLLELRSAVLASKRSASAVRKEIAVPRPSGEPRRVRLEVLPIRGAQAGGEHFLILFEVIAAGSAAPERRRKGRRDLLELKEDLAVSGENLKAIIEEQETNNARLKTSNEELLSSNEELQSINVEFETTKDELESSHKDLLASTEEVGRGNEVLSRANNDLSNLLANIDMPIVLLDPDLSIHRFTPAAARTLGLSPEKIGRSIVGIKLPLRITALKDLLRSVIKTGRVRTQEVQNTEGRWFYLILRPYRIDKSTTEKSRTEGAVMALVDIHERKLAEKTVQRLATVVLDSNDAVFVVDLEDRIIAWNKGAQTMYGYTEGQALGMSVLRLMPEKTLVRARDLARAPSAPLEARRRAKDGRTLDVLTTVTVLRDDEGRPVEVAVTDRDVTELKRAERDRKESEKTVLRLATSVIDSNDAIIICDLKDRILAWNKGAHKMYGYSEAEAVKMSIARLMPENRRLKALDLVRRTAAPVEIQRRTKGGRILDVQLTVTVLRDDKGQPVEVATTERDITEHKKAERARAVAEKNAQRLSNAVRDSNDAVIFCDLKDRILAWNKGAHRMYGYTEAEALKMSIARLMPENRRMKALDLVRRSATPVEIQRRTKGGRILDVQLTVRVLRDDKGRPVEIATTERDITEQKTAERARELSEKNALRLASAVLDSNDAVIICDLKDRILAWNKGAQTMYGYTEAEALKMSIARLMPENRRLKAQDLVRVSAAPVEIQRRTKGGRILDVQLTVTVLRDGSGQPVEIATTERDITEVKLADREFRRLHASVVSAQETERKRLARELHDGVGQILSGVKFRLQALPGKMALSGGAEAKILKVGGFLDNAIAEIRRVSQNLMPSELVDLGLGPALSTLCREFKERSGIHVTLRDNSGRSGLPPDLELALFRICQEALNNIGKHSKATMVVVSLSREGKELMLSVADNGVGFKAGGPRQPAGKGFGMGNMRQRAESVGGAFDLRSTPGTGTTLSIRMPLAGLGR